MKKLLIAFVAMAMAVVANAAAINWSVDYSYQPGADTENGPFAEGWLIAIFDAGVTETATATALTSLIQGGAADAVTTYAISTATGNADGGAFRSDVAITGDKGDTVNAYLVLFDSATAADANKFFVSSASVVIPTSGTTAGMIFGDEGDLLGSAVAKNWTAVPEPTSGLLLLVGGALLALKRRRA